MNNFSQSFDMIFDELEKIRCTNGFLTVTKDKILLDCVCLESFTTYRRNFYIMNML